MTKVDTISAVCRTLTAGDTTTAAALLTKHYEFSPAKTTKRHNGPLQATRIFIRDGFIDRYSGDRLVYPPVLRLLSMALPRQFPFTSAWRTDSTHPAFWELGASVDHLTPVTLGGVDDYPNLYTTSMARNFAKMNWTLDTLGWHLHPAGDFNSWDGLLHWFLEFTAAHPDLLKTPTVNTWHRAAKAALQSEPLPRR